MAWSKIVGFEVSPVTDRASMYCCKVPLPSKSRVMLSSQRLCPRLWSSCVAFIAILSWFLEFLLSALESQATCGACRGNAEEVRANAGANAHLGFARLLDCPPAVLPASEDHLARQARGPGEQCQWPHPIRKRLRAAETVHSI